MANMKKKICWIESDIRTEASMDSFAPFVFVFVSYQHYNTKGSLAAKCFSVLWLLTLLVWRLRCLLFTMQAMLTAFIGAFSPKMAVY